MSPTENIPSICKGHLLCFHPSFPRGEIYDLLTTKPEDAANGKQTE